jgi:hypothetical protein
MWKVKTSLERKKKIRPSHGDVGVAGVAIRALVEIFIDDISAVLRVTDLRFRLPFVSWLILKILKF